MSVINQNPTVVNFEADFRRHRNRQRLQLVVFGVLFAIAVHLSADISQFTFDRLSRALPRLGDYLFRTLPEIGLTTFFGDIAYWYYGFLRWLKLLFDTILIALLATLFGAIGGLLLCFPASRNLMDNYAVYFVCRRFAEIARTVPEVVYALIFVVAFGIGPMAGLLALTVHSIGALAKLYSEVNENIDERPMEGLRASGANWFEVIRFAVLPQVLPNLTTYTLWRLELNIRAAAIIGFVGAGGIGQELYHAISFNYYEDISAIVLMVVLTVTLIDLLCERLRHRMIGKENF
ncbi:phosphonate transport system permease protein [Natronocella acetinitrilica]|uniref:Phosphonate transport system permease protein n=1 Tax=Natronocella acetinitrilica TaxID=414046 RepID=A0AAE3G6C3_9GAMM|nr:phosphonate ABC transporter, permease protein PhnE [Natronocella acetinitrilica]MCP1676681.1 phosphonate transport system permease protein [Natronocella acetinitrilica]